jgi:hypothetical protein
MAERKMREAEISAFPDRQWKTLMEAFQKSRNALILKDEQFKDYHHRHYDQMLDRS